MSSDSSDSEDIPDVAECQLLCEKFAEITGTDEACAQFYLQDRKWNLMVSVNDFFEDRKGKSSVHVNDKNEANVVLVVDGSSESLAAAATAVIAESSLSRISRSNHIKDVKAVKPKEEDISTKLKFITWNIDGLNEKNLMLRTKAVCNTILSEKADIVFLQEVIPESSEYLLTHLTDYECLFGNDMGYFVGTLLRKSTVNCKSHSIVPFHHTRMGRNILKINASYKNSPLTLMNSHLESTADGSEQRKLQLRSVFKDVLQIDNSCTVIFAGDMNLRDKELTELGGLPAGMDDLWIACGRRQECAYTFDMTRNDNLIWNGRFKPRCRFDRVFIRHSSPRTLEPLYFGLIGLERLLPHRCFPSDHWGVMCHFKKE